MNMTIQMNNETYLNTSEACERLGITRETLNNYVNAGRIKRYKQGIKRTSYYKEVDVNKLLELREDTGTDK